MDNLNKSIAQKATTDLAYRMFGPNSVRDKADTIHQHRKWGTAHAGGLVQTEWDGTLTMRQRRATRFRCYAKRAKPLLWVHSLGRAKSAPQAETDRLDPPGRLRHKGPMAEATRTA